MRPKHAWETDLAQGGILGGGFGMIFEAMLAILQASGLCS